MFDNEVELLQMEGFDLVLAGIRLLGRDMAAIADEATGIAILEILEAETGDQQRYRLVQDMAGSARIHDRSDEILTKIMRLKQGFLEAGADSE
jgi:predicted nucleotidyltransferase